MKARCSMEVIIKRIQQMVEIKNEYLKRLQNGENLRVKVSEGNSKTGKNCRTVSLIPGHDCQNCKACLHDCYDVNNVCWQQNVQNIRALNSAIHSYNIDKYWNDIEMDIKYNYTTELRINVGGDSTYEDFIHIREIALRNLKCDFLFFTKNYNDLNKFLNEFEFPNNVRPIWSRWIGLESNNIHNVPEAHVMMSNGKTTAPEYGAYFCTGNCSECHFNNRGCWTLQEGESVVFIEH